MPCVRATTERCQTEGPQAGLLQNLTCQGQAVCKRRRWEQLQPAQLCVRGGGGGGGVMTIVMMVAV
eukprot:4050483-Prorocentrum_lima.AAC.1